jgi:hypothetical protein
MRLPLLSAPPAATPIDLVLAWGYVALRVVHSFVQATSNVILVRFTVFAVSTVVLLALTIRMALVIVEALTHPPPTHALPDVSAERFGSGTHPLFAYPRSVRSRDSVGCLVRNRGSDFTMLWSSGSRLRSVRVVAACPRWRDQKATLWTCNLKRFPMFPNLRTPY